MRPHVTSLLVCGADRRAHRESAVKLPHPGGPPIATFAGESHQSNAAKGQGVVPLPPLPKPNFPLEWPEIIVIVEKRRGMRRWRKGNLSFT